MKKMQEKLLRDISTAIVWGTPDLESGGYSHQNYTQLLLRCRDEILRLNELLADATARELDSYTLP